MATTRINKILVVLIFAAPLCQGRLPSLYYSIRRDPRKCASPLCGGWWVKGLNRKTVKCLDGTFKEECYVADIDASALGVDESKFLDALNEGDIVFGSQVKGPVSGDTQLATLRVSDGWNHFEKTPGPTCSCKSSEICIYDPNSGCDGCVCPTICIPKPKRVKCGGFAGTACPKGLTCIDNPSDKCSPECGGADCSGICVSMRTKPATCAGIAALTCNANYKCYDNPNDSCNAMCGGSDCGGICVQEVGAQCGGVAGFACGPGLKCVEPLGVCNDRCGGADCSGVCVPANT